MTSTRCPIVLQAGSYLTPETRPSVRAACTHEQVMKEWIAKRVTQLLGGLEEEVLIGMVYNFLEDPEVSGGGWVKRRREAHRTGG